MTKDELAACDVARPSTPVGWSDTDWIKHLQDQEPHPLAGLHINQGQHECGCGRLRGRIQRGARGAPRTICCARH